MTDSAPPRIPHLASARSHRLGPAERAESLDRLRSDEFDVLVIGGGIVGLGCALDAATRGLRVGLVEARDFGSGTSSRSSRLVHGGIRYLEQLDFALVREALIERSLLLERVAPHLVKPVRFLYPLTVPLVERLYIGAGMTLYDLFSYTGGRPPGVPHHRHLTRSQLPRTAPGLDASRFVGGLAYYDAQVDDARYVATLARTAAAYGADVVSRTRVERLLREGDRVVGVAVRDLESGDEFEVRAKEVVSATGVWTGDTLGGASAAATASSAAPATSSTPTAAAPGPDVDAALANDAPDSERIRVNVRASKGVHLVVPRERFRSKVGLLLRTEKSVLFVIPWGRHWLIGTTDTDWNLDKAHPAATAADIDYLLGKVNEVLRDPLTRDDVVGVYAGLRPLLSGESDETSKLSREHVVGHVAPGLVVVAGGKWTTYRVMAKDAIDEALRGLGLEVPSVTEHIGLVGAEGYRAAWNRRRALARAHGLSREAIERLLDRHGAAADEVLALISERPELAEPLPGSPDYLRAEAVHAATHEAALHVDDVLARRTRLSTEADDRGVAAAAVVAELLADVLGWSADRVALEVARYEERVAAEIASQQQPDDVSADRERLKAREVVGFGDGPASAAPVSNGPDR